MQRTESGGHLRQGQAPPPADQTRTSAHPIPIPERRVFGPGGNYGMMARWRLTALSGSCLGLQTALGLSPAAS